MTAAFIQIILTHDPDIKSRLPNPVRNGGNKWMKSCGVLGRDSHFGDDVRARYVCACWRRGHCDVGTGLDSRKRIRHVVVYYLEALKPIFRRRCIQCLLMSSNRARRIRCRFCAPSAQEAP